MHRQPADIPHLRPVGGSRPPPLPEMTIDLCGWTVQPRLLCALRDGVQVRIEERLMQLLVCLHGAIGEPVTRDAIMSAVWGHAHVTEDALNRLVSRLRRVLSHDLACDATIETIPKVGYRLVAAPTVATEMSAASPAAPAAAAGHGRRRGYALGAIALVCLALAALRLLPAPRAARSVLSDPQTRTVPLTSFPGQEIQATLSPDGNQVAFARRPTREEPWDIYVRPVTSDTLLRVTAGDGNSLRPAWSPDGQWLAYLRVAEEQCDIRLVSPVGGPARSLGPCDATLEEDLAWTNDARGLVFHARDGRGLVLQQIDSGETRPLTDPPEGEYDALPTWSPDGSTLAFVRWINFGVADVYVAPASGGPARRITHDNLKVHGLAWGDDARHVVYSSNRGGSFALWRVDLESGAAERVPIAARTVDLPVVSRDGRRLVYEEWAGQASIFVLDTRDAQAAPAQVTASTRWDWNPQPAPDGSGVVFASDRSGAVELWIEDANGGEPRRLTTFAGPYIGSPSWSHDAREIALESPAADGNFDIYRIPAAGGPAERLTDDPAPDRFPHYTPDGGAVVFASLRGGEWALWRLDLATRASERLTEGGACFGYEGEDGAVYYSKNDEAGLWQLDTKTGAHTLLVSSLAPIDCANWTLAGDTLWYVERDAEQNPQLAMLAPGADARVIGALPRLLYKSGLGVDRDGRVYYSSVVSSETDLVMTELVTR
jgi:Tol biopolymer transport system component/DNA-binding winged helix-turn-helix (wHTH) protein